MKVSVACRLGVGICLVIFAVHPVLYAKSNPSVYASLFIGPNVTHSSDIQIGEGGLMGSTMEGVEYKPSFTYGGRLGIWLDNHWGFALDTFSYRATPKDQTVDLTNLNGSMPMHLSEENIKYTSTGVSWTFLYRHWAAENLFAYGGIGPTLYFNHVRSEAGVANDDGTAMGFSLPLGVQANLINRPNYTLGLFSELKLTYNPTIFDVIGIKLSSNLLTTHVLFGLSLGFDLAAPAPVPNSTKKKSTGSKAIKGNSQKPKTPQLRNSVIK